jgi:hypothetical protein
MKFKATVSSDRSKSRKAHFKSDSATRRKLMSAHLDKELATKYNVRFVLLDIFICTACQLLTYASRVAAGSFDPHSQG